MLFEQLAFEDIPEYRNCLRMFPDSFYLLMAKISPRMQRTMREAILSRIKLEVTISYLPTGNSFQNLQHKLHVSRPAFSKFIPVVCDAIFDILKEFIEVSVPFLN